MTQIAAASRPTPRATSQSGARRSLVAIPPTRVRRAPSPGRGGTPAGAAPPLRHPSSRTSARPPPPPPGRGPPRPSPAPARGGTPPGQELVRPPTAVEDPAGQQEGHRDGDDGREQRRDALVDAQPFDEDHDAEGRHEVVRGIG